MRLLSLILPRITHIHFLGGGYCTSFWQHHYFLLVLAGLIKQHYRIPVYWTGGSLCPIKDFQVIDLLPFLAHFDYIGFRDTESYHKISKDLPETVKMTSDDLILGLLLGLIKPPTPSSQPVLLINMQSDLFSSALSANRTQCFLNKIQSFTGKGYRKFFLEFNPECDSEQYHSLKQTITDIQMIPFNQLWQTTLLGTPSLDILHPESYALGSRFHFHYYLAWHGIAGEFVSETPYYDIKHKSICDFGSPWIPLNQGATYASKPSLQKETLLRYKQADFDRIYPK
jgi:hypothetical protein